MKGKLKCHSQVRINSESIYFHAFLRIRFQMITKVENLFTYSMYGILQNPSHVILAMKDLKSAIYFSGNLFDSKSVINKFGTETLSNISRQILTAYNVFTKQLITHLKYINKSLTWLLRRCVISISKFLPAWGTPAIFW